MGAPVNPLLSGLFNAMNIANLIQRGKRENERLDLEKRQQAESENRNAIDLQTKLQAHGIRVATPSDELEANLGKRVDFQNTLSPGVQGLTDESGQPMTAGAGLPTQTPVFSDSDIAGRMFKINGVKYVRPSQTEQDARQAADDQRTVKLEGSKEGARVGERNIGYQQRLQTTGLRPTDEASAAMGIQPGGYVPPEKVDDISRAFSTAQKKKEDAAKPAAPPKVVRTTIDDSGDAHLLYSDGSEQVIKGAGKQTRQLLGRAAAQLTPGQAGVQNRFQAKALDNAQKDNQKDQAAEQKLWGDYGEIANQLTNRKTIDKRTGAERDLDPLTEASLRNRAATLKQQIGVLQKAQKQRIEKFGGTYSNGAAATSKADPLGIR